MSKKNKLNVKESIFSLFQKYVSKHYVDYFRVSYRTESSVDSLRNSM